MKAKDSGFITYFLPIIIILVTVGVLEVPFVVKQIRPVTGPHAVLGTETTSSPTPTSTGRPTHSNTATPTATPTTAQQYGTKSQSTNRTKVVVNGKEITPDANGDVNYQENEDGSNVSVKINNSVNSQSSTTIHEENSVKVNVMTD